MDLTPSLDTAPLTRAELRLLDHLARGHTNQEIATRFHAAPSTVCAWTRTLASRFGVPPIDLVLVGALCTTGELSRWAHVSVEPDRASLALAIPRAVGDALTAAELEIARHIVDGHSARDIARARHTSERTVANQIANVYRKLRTSARRECTLVLHGGARHLWADLPATEPAVGAA
ncbi:MAG: helix-turn-helix transcriptional regulator [Sandaracinus sp.]